MPELLIWWFSLSIFFYWVEILEFEISGDFSRCFSLHNPIYLMNSSIRAHVSRVSQLNQITQQAHFTGLTVRFFPRFTGFVWDTCP